MRSLAIVALLATSAAAEPEARFVKIIQDAASGYKKWSRVDERPNLAPVLCRAPLPDDYGKPARARLSAADEGPHHDKLFYLWASNKSAYLRHETVPEGFAIVKQSFTTKKRVPTETVAPDQWSMGTPPPITWTKTAHGELEIDKPRELYVMARAKGDDTDAGWIYGTVTTDGVVTSAGRVGTCMHCHVDAPHGRLFGLPKD